jgi:hypothetical protein
MACGIKRSVNLTPLFEWGSVASFRPDDPIILVVSGIQVEAMMQLKEGYAVPCLSGPRDPLVYVSFLEVAPWNQLQSSKRYLKGLGQLLLRLACERSEQLGYGGRIGLHALQSAEGFYKRLGFNAPICPNEYTEVYFELDGGGVQDLVKKEV